MKKTNNFFKILFNFFDRYIIMPITRFIFNVTKKMSKPNKKFETWLSKSTTLLFLSLFLAITIFIVVDRKIITFSSQSAEVFKDQKVNVIYNEEQYVVEGLPEKVDVTLIGSKADLYIALRCPRLKKAFRQFRGCLAARQSTAQGYIHAR